MLLNSQNRNSVFPVLSANLGGLVLEAVVTRRMASLSKRRIVSQRPTRLSNGGTAIFPILGQSPATGHRHSPAPTVDIRRQARCERGTQATQPQPAPRDYQAAPWAAVVMSKMARG